ncbi:MAG: hypothetical protein JW751_25315 [Polyangiaceae bacterium]|nr:hypothetical protein [Polyangiaceae bacterium]
MVGLEEIECDDDHWLGVSGPLIVLFWTGKMDPRVFRRLAGIVSQVVRRQPEGCATVLSVSLPGATAPSPEARVALADLIRDTHGSVSRVAVVHEGYGFIASIVASVATAAHTLANRGARQRIFGDLASAVDWITAPAGERLGGRAWAAEVRFAVERRHRLLLERARC